MASINSTPLDPQNAPPRIPHDGIDPSQIPDPYAGVGAPRGPIVSAPQGEITDKQGLYTKPVNPDWGVGAGGPDHNTGGQPPLAQPNQEIILTSGEGDTDSPLDVAAPFAQFADISKAIAARSGGLVSDEPGVRNSAQDAVDALLKKGNDASKQLAEKIQNHMTTVDGQKPKPAAETPAPDGGVRPDGGAGPDGGTGFTNNEDDSTFSGSLGDPHDMIDLLLGSGPSISGAIGINPAIVGQMMTGHQSGRVSFSNAEDTLSDFFSTFGKNGLSKFAVELVADGKLDGAEFGKLLESFGVDGFGDAFDKAQGQIDLNDSLIEFGIDEEGDLFLTIADEDTMWVAAHIEVAPEAAETNSKSEPDKFDGII